MALCASLAGCGGAGGVAVSPAPGSAASLKASGEVVSNTLSNGDIPLCECYRDDRKAKPLVILLHGGGSKEKIIPWAEDLARQGFYAQAVGTPPPTATASLGPWRTP